MNTVLRLLKYYQLTAYESCRVLLINISRSLNLCVQAINHHSFELQQPTLLFQFEMEG